MRFAPLALAAWSLCIAPALRSETLGEALAAHHAAVHGLPAGDLQKSITSYAVSADAEPFLIAYYDDDGSGSLPPLLHVLRYDGRTGQVRRGDLRGADVPFHGFRGLMDQVSKTCMGSALAIVEKDGFITVDTHVSPSAGCVLVLTPDLKFSAGLWGWVLARVGGGLVFEESMVHFAPTHAARVSLYEPGQRRVTPIYPANGDEARRQFSAELRKQVASSKWCSEQNHPCDPENFSSDIDHVTVAGDGRSFAFDVRMDAEGFGEEAARSVAAKTVHYLCRQSGGRWILSSK